MVAEGKGILAADESNKTMTKRLESVGADSTAETRRRFRELLVTTSGVEEHISGVILYDETIRQAASDGSTVSGAAHGPRHDPGDQGRYGRQAPRRGRRGDGDRGPRWAPRAPRRVPRSRSAICEVAGRHLDRRRPSEPLLHRCQCACARALRRALPGGRHRPDRRARGADGRRPFGRPLRGGDRRHAARGVRRTARSARAAGGHRAEAQHGAIGLRVSASRPASRRSRSARCGCCAAWFPPRFRASRSCPAVRATSRRPPT